MDNIKQLSSVNIIRDQDKSIEYISTENSKRIANFILNEFDKGVHSFSIIGSYGTGKSSFLWAFNRSISNSNKDNFFDFNTNNIRKTEFINIVGEYNSLISYFKTYFSIENKLKGNQEIFDCIYQKYEKVNKQNGFLVICIDELGKFLEYASKHNPEKEMYFIQQLAEFVNDSNRNIILLTSVHQAIDSYSNDLSDSQKNEWKKVKGRLCEITFNEPIEQLLFLASQHFSSKYKASKKYISYNENLNKFNQSNNCFSISRDYINNIGNNLYPLDIFSAITLTYSLQRYGQNERSLFTFLNTSDHLGLESLKENELFDIPKLYDYLLVNLYSILVSKHNSDYTQWALIKNSIERAEAKVEANQNLAINLLKTIGLFNLFASKGASINEKLLLGYLSYSYSTSEIKKSLKSLEKFKIIRFNNFNNSFKLFGGTDMDIEGAILKASDSIDESLDLVHRLKEAFDFPILTAKETLYRTGTPRLFKFSISENPSFEIAENEIDGFINLIFNEKLSEEDVIEQTTGKDLPILYGLYKNSSTIKKTLLDIVKTEKVLSDVDADDKFAKLELRNIIKSQKSLLNYYVLDSLYSRNIEWFFNGQRLQVESKQKLNQILSEICTSVYPNTPKINMELINRHKVSGTINGSRKSYFDRLVNNWNEKDLGYPEDKFPSDKTIYWSLIKNNGIHRIEDGNYVLISPNSDDENFIKVWQECELFLQEAKKEQRPITDLINTLKQKPYKLKQGIIDFLIPTFLFVRRGDFALYNVDGGYMPYINETILYLITRNPHEYTVKSFELDNLRLNLFNKYRVYLNQDMEDSMTNESFIESVRPFLILYKGLTDYSTRTKRLSQEALKLRSAISHAEDPEKIFFEQFPTALGYNVKELIENEQLFDEYIIKFQKTILEVKDSYKELLNRFENFITLEVLGSKNDFPKYKTLLQRRFVSLKEHQILPSQKTFMLRVNSDLDDRDSWLNSICFSLLSKPLDRISDKDEDILKEKLSFIVKELDNLCEIKNVNFDESEEEIYKIDFTSQNQGLKNHLVRISKQQKEEVKKSIVVIENSLGDDKQLRIAVLSELLKKELNE
ncbi:hypothetical protein [Winogradskyella psychrotolerans]|uniref:hypothetical protein n=1 Tax=Winogradskyella psychrotolerans TaxID=1344585 RepID=UPI001C07860B|nr:hypothetical protein [Winogradskyella psychrotolerans]MBU2926713.1 hypothetical protein [Winogradskyella psychrotolerans]